MQNIDPLVSLALSLITSLSPLLIAKIPTLAAAAVDIINGLTTACGAPARPIPAAIDIKWCILRLPDRRHTGDNGELPEIIDAIVTASWRRQDANGIDLITAHHQRLFSVHTLWTTASRPCGRIWDAIINGLASLADLINAVEAWRSGESVTGRMVNGL